MPCLCEHLLPSVSDACGDMQPRVTCWCVGEGFLLLNQQVSLGCMPRQLAQQQQEQLQALVAFDIEREDWEASEKVSITRCLAMQSS